MAGVAKWLRQWVVIPSFAGSSPVTRPLSYSKHVTLYIELFKKFSVSFNFFINENEINYNEFVSFKKFKYDYG